MKENAYHVKVQIYNVLRIDMREWVIHKGWNLVYIHGALGQDWQPLSEVN